MNSSSFISGDTVKKIAVLVLIASTIFSFGFSKISADVNPDSSLASTTCFTPNTLGDSKVVVLGESWDGSSFNLQNILNNDGFSINVANDQLHYQTWTPAKDNTTFTVKAISHISAYDSVFGYFKADSTFHPIYKTSNISGFDSVPLWTEGQGGSVTISGKDPVTFAIYVSNTSTYRYTKVSSNTPQDTFALVYKNSGSENYLVAFEDLAQTLSSPSDMDFNDIVTQLSSINCADNHVNQPPTLTLVGSNPINVTINNIFTDTGATATDLEDGDITANIVKTGTVDTTVLGTYTLTYNVSDSQGLAATPVTRVVNVVPASNSCTITVVSDGTNKLLNGMFATSTYSANPRWTAHIPGAIWIWSTFFVEHPLEDEFTTFTKTFDAGVVSSTTLNSAEIVLNADNSFVASINGLEFGSDSTEFNYFVENQHTYNLASYLHNGVNTLSFTVKNWALPDSDSTTNPAGILYKLVVTKNGDCLPFNNPPTLTLVGSNPINVTINTPFTDPGASAQDPEDGDITAHIVATSTVNIAVLGTYAVTYNVSDSQGLAATPVTRTVNVVPADNGGGGETKEGKITFCVMFANNDNAIATTSTGLPASSFIMNLASSTDISSSTLSSKTWTSGAFTPNRKVILNVNDADCVSYNNLDLGTYYYSELSISGSSWNTPKYNDSNNQPINNVFDFFSYSGELFTATTTDDSARNLNSDGQIILTNTNKEQTVVAYTTYKPVADCSECGGGGGSPANADIKTTKTVDRTTANVGDLLTYTITVINNGPDNAINVAVLETFPSLLDFVSATSTLGTYSTTTSIWTIGDLLNGSSTSLTLIGTIKSGSEGQKITNTVVASSTTNDSNTSDNTTSVDTNVNNPGGGGGGGGGCTSNCGGGNGGGGGGGGNGPISTFVPVNGGGNGPIVPQVAGANTCYYLRDYLKKGWNNDPAEVTKLQIFLRDLEGFTNIQITGVYDDQTIVALDAFQDRYKPDILTPWGHTAPTSFTYILTKKKVNEIYCKMAFPVTPQQQEEIDTFRNFLLSLQNSGVILPEGNEGFDTDEAVGTNTDTIKDIVKGTSTKIANGLSTLAGVSSTTSKIASNLVANVIASGKKLANLIVAMFTWPFGGEIKNLFSKANQCIVGFGAFGWLNLILILVILVISYLWYREYKNNKNIESINKEIDLSK